jgi:predicted Zn-dependent peptidase
MATHPTQGEVDRAKAQLKASLLLGLDGTTAVAEDIGRSVVTTGKRSTPKEIEAAIDAVTVEDIKRCGQKYINDKGEFSFFLLPFLTKAVTDPHLPSSTQILLLQPLDKWKA